MNCICLDCYEVYDKSLINFDLYREWNYCPKANCNGDVVEIDELILPAIKILNQKGYMTKYCCSGHTYENPNSYISFEDYVELPNLPKGYSYDKDLYPHVNWDGHAGMSCIRRSFNTTNELILHQEILSNAITLLEWAWSLDDFVEE